MIIPTSGVALAALFLIIPIYVMWAFRINLTRQFTNTVVTMLLKLGIVAAEFLFVFGEVGERRLALLDKIYPAIGEELRNAQSYAAAAGA